MLMKVGTPTNSYTTCLHKFMTQMDDQTFFKVPRLLKLRIQRGCLSGSLIMHWSGPLDRTDGVTCTTTMLPTSIPLTFLAARRLAKIQGNVLNIATSTVLLVQSGQAERLISHPKCLWVNFEKSLVSSHQK